MFNIQPRTIIAITVAVALVMVISAWVELRQSRTELYHVLDEEAVSLIEAIERSSANNILAMDEIETVLTERLLNNAFFIARLDSLGRLTASDLARIATENTIFRINIFNRNGDKVLTSYTPHDEHAGLAEKHNPRDVLQPILQGKTDRLLIGVKEARFESGQRFAVAIRRTKRGGGAIVLNLDAATLLEFRRTIGIGKLINDFRDNSGLEYVALQDSAGIIAASKAVEELSSFAVDSVLRQAQSKDSTFTRVASFRGTDVYEAIQPLIVEKEVLGVLRIGLSMDEIRATETRMLRRMLIVSLVLFVLGAIVLLAIVASQNLRLIEHKYGAMRTLTGNILEHMQDAVVTLDAAGKISLFNKQAVRLFGLAEEAVLGKQLSQLPSGNCLVDVFSGTTTASEQTIHCTDGVQRDVGITLSTTRSPDGTVESKTAVIKDLTERRRMEREVQRKEKLTAMGELASGVAHEIRNPLNAIAMIAQRYEKEFTPQNDADEYRQLTQVLKSEVHRVNKIVHQFLRFARPPKLNLQNVSSLEFVKHVATLFESEAKAKGVMFTVDACDVQLPMDREQLTQAFLNLLQNALHATPPGGTITLSCSTNGSDVQFVLRDSGEGIPNDALPKIFNLYYTTKPDGTGMGLALTQQIVTQHRGMIEVASEVGAGSLFTITIPLSGTI